MYGYEYTKFTVFHVLWLAAVTAGAVVGFKLGQHFGPTGTIACAIIGLVVAHVLFGALMAWDDKRFFKLLARSSNEELRAMVAADDWKFNHTMTLLNLAARGEDVRMELPRILAMLESDSELTRRFGWDALRIVFAEETKIIEDYNPRGSTEDCRSKTAKLKAALQESGIRATDTEQRMCSPRE